MAPALPYSDANSEQPVTGADAGSTVSIPTDMPEGDKNAKAYDQKNFAGNEETVAKFLSATKTYFGIFDTQPARTKMIERMNTADKYYRLSSGQDKQTHNQTSDGTDTIPHVFHTVVNILTANECDILFGQRELPMKYIPLRNLPAMAVPEAQQMCDDRNVQLEYSMAEDDRVTQMKQTLFFLKKYGNRIIGMDWYEKRRKTKRKNARSGKMETVTLIEAHPQYHDYNMEDFWFDCQINDFGLELENQQCIIHRYYPLYQELYAEQEEKRMVNVDAITKKQLFQSESPATTKGDRQTNAGESGDSNRPNGLLMAQHSWLRAPINDKGEWDEEGTLATWHWATFVGDISGTDVICTRLIKNPFEDGELLYKLIHSHKDDKGNIHLGLIDVIEPAWNEYKTTLDQWFENKNLVNNAPWKAEVGAVINADKGFGPSQLKLMRQGKFDKLERIMVPSNTNDMQRFLDYLETKIYVDLAGMTKAYRGEEMGSRTSALEASNALSQSQKPGMEQVKYVADQMLPWIAYKDAMLWRQFADPAIIVGLSLSDPTKEIKPADMWGDFRVKVTAVESYVSTMMARQEQDRFLQINMPMAGPDMGKRGRINTYRHIFGTRGFPVEEMFPMVSETDARHVAGSENVGFLTGIVDEPQDGEDHDIHIQEHESFIAILKTLPKDSTERTTAMPLAEQHLLIHKQKKQGEETQVAGAGAAMQQKVAGMGTGETPPQNDGQAAQQMLGAEGGIQSA